MKLFSSNDIHLRNGMLQYKSLVISAGKLVKYAELITINITTPFYTKQLGTTMKLRSPTVKSRFFYCLESKKNKLTLDV